MKEINNMYGCILPSGTTEGAVPYALQVLFNRNFSTSVIGEACLEEVSALCSFGELD